MKIEVFNLTENCKCICFDNEMACICQTNERFVRNYIAGNVTEPMTEAQREYCISTADWCWEGAYTREELEKLSDKDLAYNLMDAWLTYAQSL